MEHKRIFSNFHPLDLMTGWMLHCIILVGDCGMQFPMTPLPTKTDASRSVVEPDHCLFDGSVFCRSSDPDPVFGDGSVLDRSYLDPYLFVGRIPIRTISILIRNPGLNLSKVVYDPV